MTFIRKCVKIVSGYRLAKPVKLFKASYFDSMGALGNRNPSSKIPNPGRLARVWSKSNDDV
jgi:hypothetical protein